MTTFLEKSNNKIRKAGIELETKGIEVYSYTLKNGRTSGSTNTNDYELDYVPKHRIFNSNPKIEFDTDNLEYVSVPHKHEESLFKALSQAQAFLIGILNRVPSNGEALLYDDQYLIRKSSYPLYLARPQITFEINKGGLPGFLNSLDNNQIYYREGRDIKGNQFRGQIWEQIDPHVFSELGNVFAEIDRDTSPNIKTENVKALAKMVFLAHISAYLKQKATQYYKARFGILPRTSFYRKYKKLSKPEKVQYQDIMRQLERNTSSLCIESGDDSITTPIQFSSALQSTYLPSSNSLKTIPGRIHRKKREALASDYMATTGDVGASVGMLHLPENSDGIYEMRKLPYVSLDSPNETSFVYQDIINHYSR